MVCTILLASYVLTAKVNFVYATLLPKNRKRLVLEYPITNICMRIDISIF